MATNSETSHKINQRDEPDDDFYTPIELAKKCIDMTPLKDGDLVLDSAKGHGAFYNNYPDFVEKDYCEIEEGIDFLEYDKEVDWIVTNPPYSDLDTWYKKSAEITRKGVAYLFHLHNITPRRIEMMEERGFGLDHIHMCKVKQWYGMSAFTIFRRGVDHCISYDRNVWRVPRDEE
jgi:hypothetical protein